MAINDLINKTRNNDLDNMAKALMSESNKQKSQFRQSDKSKVEKQEKKNVDKPTQQLRNTIQGGQSNQAIQNDNRSDDDRSRSQEKDNKHNSKKQGLKHPVQSKSKSENRQKQVKPKTTPKPLNMKKIVLDNPIESTPQTIVDIYGNKRELTPQNEYALKKWGFSPLEMFTTNLNEKIAKKSEDFEVFGRDKEVKDVFVSWARVNKNAPILLGEAGTGKTAIVDGVVVKILRGEVLDRFKNVTIWSLELANITSESTLPNGERLNLIGKLNLVIDELKATKGINTLFIDEVHTIVGSGGSGSSMLDAGNVIKPALARGEVDIIAATTLDEYQKSIETDPALQRRFQVVPCDEPSVDDAIYICKQIKRKYERNHGIHITDEAVEHAVKLSKRYITDLFLPDKALDLMDVATAVAEIEGRKKVDSVDIARVIQKLKKVPLENIIREENEPIINYEEALSKRVKGQELAVATVSRAMYRSKEGLQDGSKPRASFMLLGTTGVGKTELVKALAEVEFGDEEAVIRIDCSEYQTKDAVERLIGQNKIDSKGTLTDAVKKNPYSIVLLDEFDKADRSVHDLCLQILDDGRLSTGTGRTVSFKDTIIVATTNAGADQIKESYKNKGNFRNLSEMEYNKFIEMVKDDLGRMFRPEFLNRWGALVVFNMLSSDIVKDIVNYVMEKERKTLFNHSIELVYEDKDALFDYLIAKGTDEENGARPLNRLVTDKIIDEVAMQLYKLGRHGSWYRCIVHIEGSRPSLRVDTGQHEHFDYRKVEIIPEKLNHVPTWETEPIETGKLSIARDEYNRIISYEVDTEYLSQKNGEFEDVELAF